MYPITVPGLQAVTTQPLSQTDTQLYVDHLDYFDDAPNLCTIKKSSTEFEVCKYTAKTVVSGTAGYLTIVRSGDEHLSSTGSAQTFSSGVKAFRSFSNWDYGGFMNNISDLNTRVIAQENQMDPIIAAIIFG
ncbi:MAG TPA: hypothetical protein VN429_00745 [Methanospirillum sp.]|uniref:hypothetical protein n=1 Tax=Methanospirillum sp. TaxID=45200 RepID=UPI002CED362C|nr:hypothetical protein [Methanospirillum sp.]HWQ62911.1 hypothetical protein [Methanospirillum sp.]